jgi:tetratricopeptide (TPR) repeat protein
MAVVIDDWSVVARRDVVERALPDGLAGWQALAPNPAWCADAGLCAVGFFTADEAHAFAAMLATRGLVGAVDGAYRDLAVVAVDGVRDHACAWLAVGRWAGVNAAWLAGTDPEPIVVPWRWQRPADALDPDVARQLAAQRPLIERLLVVAATPAGLNVFERTRLGKAIRAVEPLARDDRWQVWWLLGRARRAAQQLDGAVDALARAHAGNPGNLEIANQLAAAYLAVGLGDRAIAACERCCELRPDDAGLRGNLALACVIAGDLPRAQAEVGRARAMAPADELTAVLARLVDEVAAGKRARPTRYP